MYKTGGTYNVELTTSFEMWGLFVGCTTIKDSERNAGERFQTLGNVHHLQRPSPTVEPKTVFPQQSEHSSLAGPNASLFFVHV